MLEEKTVAGLARVALANVQREYPRRLDQLLTRPGMEWRPRALHPAFYGSYDWHSAVHMHWTLARALRLRPALDRELAPVLDAHLGPATIERELAFFVDQPWFERPYGWAWLLELQAELMRLGRWHPAVAPLALHLARRFGDWVGTLPYPVRAGTHGNTAFASILALDYATTVDDKKLVTCIADAARRWYLADRDYPVAYEPSADDFLSPALVEAVLMKRVLSAAEFEAWMSAFLPSGPGSLLEPPTVTDHADAKQSHLDGLCLSRAWCLSHLGRSREAKKLLEAGMPHVAGGDYAGEHWLASFALLALSAEALKTP